tara:strand:- start:1448 stop:2695 length:1248 start_codon:yes stop_codon:yes gene_type:complete
MLFVYRVMINIILFISPLIIFFRLLKKKEDSKRFKEKFSYFSKKRVKGRLLWFHGASVGELLSIVPILEKLEKNKGIKQILVTSNTVSSSKILSNLKFKKTIHQFFPIDTKNNTKIFLQYWKPSVAIFIDSEIWPNMMININQFNIPSILLNARITKKTFMKWNKVHSFANKLFKQFDLCLPSDEQSKRYLKLLGATNIKYIGNLKFSQSEKEEWYFNDNLKKKFKSKRIWCASSTHDSEEILCAIVHKKLKKKYSNLLTIIIPRHIDRAEKIVEEIKKLDLKVQLHESKQQIKNDTDIYLVNSYGKTKNFFRICKIVFLGGSVIKHGGQNPLEAVRYGCKTLHGPNIWNFKEIYALLHRYNFSSKIQNSNQLAHKVNKMIENKTTSKNVKLKIKNLGNKILNNTLREISPYINK